MVGSGAREHALCVSLADDTSVTELTCAPGNPGTQAIAAAVPVEISDPAAVTALARQVAADLVVIGPEAPLVAGVADAVRAAGVACFGPSAAAARIEGSKSFAKGVMADAGVPTAAAVTCTGPVEAAAALDRFGPPYVVKNDGLAAGKGVVVTPDRDAALAHAAACGQVVVEGFLDGPELSLFCLADGRSVVPLLPAQDSKRLGDGDCGPNTGGMGAYCPLPWLPAGTIEHIVARIVLPTVRALADRGTPFAGLLYTGLAMTADGPRVVEFNARFGDPETQSVLALLRTPLAGLLFATATGGLDEHPPLSWRDGAAVSVVLAARGYPDSPRSGDIITGADTDGVLHAGTRRDDARRLVTAGGRVLSVTAAGADLAAARRAAYQRVGEISFDGAQWRTDIAATASRAAAADSAAGVLTGG